MKRIRFRLMALLLLLYWIPTSAHATKMLIPGGSIVGLELKNDTVTVVSFEEGSQAKAAGLEAGDRLLAIDGHPITCAQDVRDALIRSDGHVELTVIRADTVTTLRCIPAITAEGPKLGVYLRQGVTGIGTITYYDPDTKLFGTLGHGVNDASGQLIALTEGCAYPAKVTSVRKGRPGHPGQLLGTLTSYEQSGTLLRNTAVGVFGTLEAPLSGEPLPVGSSESIRTGSATILSTVTGGPPQEYSVEILKIYSAARQNGRNLLLRVTDPALLSTTGGIVQGMSGSPIIQDGKLVGAVTHVLVNDPTTGYGIFIENMLDAAA